MSPSTLKALARRFGLTDGLQLHRPGFRYNTDAAAVERTRQAYADADAADANAWKDTASVNPPGKTGAHQSSAKPLPPMTPAPRPIAPTTRKWRMPGADLTDSLLRSTSWAAEKLFKHHGGQFTSVLFIAEHADGTRQRLERFCNNAPNSATDAELLTELANDVALDFAESKCRVARFGVAYLCKRVITLRPADPDSPIKPTTTRRQGVIIELHDSCAEPVGIFRDIIRSSGGKAMLARQKSSKGPSTRARMQAF